jgi:hypothetical protein
MKRSILALAASLALLAVIPAAAQTEHANPQNDGAAFGVQHAAATPSAGPNQFQVRAKAKSQAAKAKQTPKALHPKNFQAPSNTHASASMPRTIAYLHIPNIVTLTIHRTTGKTEVYKTHNSRVNAGASAIAQLIGSGAATPFNYVALSSDATAVAATDTTCPSEYTTNGLARKAATYGGYVAPGSLGGSASYTETASWTSTANTQAINKICALNASSSGTLGFETILGSTVTLNNGDTGNLTWTFNI